MSVVYSVEKKSNWPDRSRHDGGAEFAHQRLHKGIAVHCFFRLTLAFSALAVAGTSAYALRAFLRSKIEQKIPASLAQVRDRLDLWYAQRSFDVEVFAQSATVVEGVSRLTSRQAGRNRAEVEQYLRYVLQSLSQYPAIFALDAKGSVLLAVGFAALPIYGFRTIDELKRELNFIGFTGGCIAVLAGFPVWAVLHAGGLVPPPRPEGIWLLAFISMIASYAYARWRL